MPDSVRKPRNLAQVINRMLPLIPGDQERLRADLERAQYDAMYTPPECLWEIAELGAQILFRHLGPKSDDQPDWVFRILRIWRAEDVEPNDYVF